MDSLTKKSKKNLPSIFAVERLRTHYDNNFQVSHSGILLQIFGVLVINRRTHLRSINTRDSNVNEAVFLPAVITKIIFLEMTVTLVQG